MRTTRIKVTLYIGGLLILTLGIALTIQSKLGTSPFDALLVGLFRTFGLTIGSWEMIVGASMLLINAYLQKKRPEYLGLVTAFIVGLGIDFWVFTLQHWLQPESLFGQVLCLTLGMIFIGLGIATYLQAKLTPIPMDRSMLVVQELTGFSVTISRALISIVLVILAFIFSGPIGIGTLLIALFSGVFISFFMPYIQRFEQHLELRRTNEQLSAIETKGASYKA